MRRRDYSERARVLEHNLQSAECSGNAARAAHELLVPRNAGDTVLRRSIVVTTAIYCKHSEWNGARRHSYYLDHTTIEWQHNRIHSHGTD